MPKDTTPDPTDRGTLRPKEKPLRKSGTCFQPMKIEQRDLQITLPPGITSDDPFALFRLYYNSEIIDSIVQSTNNHLRAPIGPYQQHSRASDWTPTTPPEIYIYLAIRIYMTLCVCNEISDYWNTSDITPSHPITRHISRNRFQELHMRFRIGSNYSHIYSKVEPLASHIRSTNLSIWKPGTDVVVDEIVVPFEGRSREITTIPNKPNPTGIKVWGLAQVNFLITWNWHTPGQQFGPVDTQTPYELGGTKKEGKGGNKTQAVVVKLMGQLPGTSYHLWVDNLFTSTKFLEYMRTLGYGVTGTVRLNGGIVPEILATAKEDIGDMLPWGTLVSYPTESNMVCQIGWKDSSFAKIMSTVLDGNAKVTRLRRRPKQGQKKPQQKHLPFGEEARKSLDIPECFDKYNYRMGAVDGFDHLSSMNSGLRPIKRGGWQALEHWLLRTVLVNTYVVAKQLKKQEPDLKDFRSQVVFRQGIIAGLLALATNAQDMPMDVPVSKKRRISHTNPEPFALHIAQHHKVKMRSRKWCVYCGGLRCGDRPQKRKALAEIAIDCNRSSDKRLSSHGCKECGVALCGKKRDCFDRYHQNL